MAVSLQKLFPCAVYVTLLLRARFKRMLADFLGLVLQGALLSSLLRGEVDCSVWVGGCGDGLEPVTVT